jgi:hypothetical protein
MTNDRTNTHDEAAIRELIDRFVAAFRDIDGGVMSGFAEDIVCALESDAR